MRKLTHEEFEEKVYSFEKLRNLKAITKYEGNNKPITMRCETHGCEFTTTPASLFQGCNGCPICVPNKTSNKYDLQQKMNSIETVKHLIVVGEYVNANTDIDIFCSIHNIKFNAKPTKLLAGQNGCPDCGRKTVKLDISEVRELFKTRNYEMLDNIYINSSGKIKYRCLKHPDITQATTVDSLKQGKGCKLCAIEVISSKSRKSHEKYAEEILLLSPTIRVNGKYINAHKKIEHECLVCGYKWNVTPDGMLNGHGCPCCSYNIIVKGINDLWTTNPILANMLKNPDDGYKIARISKKKVEWICPECNTVIVRSPRNISHDNVINCRVCGDGFSIASKLIYNILLQCNVIVEPEKIFDWCMYEMHGDIKRGIYDYMCCLGDKEWLIEVDGEYHRHPHVASKMTLECAKFIDDKKDELALKHGFEVIRIPCNSLMLDDIKNEIYNSKLSQIVDLGSVGWNYCYQRSLQSRVILVCKLLNEGMSNTNVAKQIGISISTVIGYKKVGIKLGLCKIENMSNECWISVVCDTTKQRFLNLQDASKVLDVSYSNLSSVLRNNYKGTGTHSGRMLKWAYYNPELHKDYELVIPQK